MLTLRPAILGEYFINRRLSVGVNVGRSSYVVYDGSGQGLFATEAVVGPVVRAYVTDAVALLVAYQLNWYFAAGSSNTASGASSELNARLSWRF